MDNKIYEFTIYIDFKDNTSTVLTTYDDNEDAENAIMISDGCYVVTVNDLELKRKSTQAYPIANNIKEIVITPVEIR